MELEASFVMLVNWRIVIRFKHVAERFVEMISRREPWNSLAGIASIALLLLLNQMFEKFFTKSANFFARMPRKSFLSRAGVLKEK